MSGTPLRLAPILVLVLTLLPLAAPLAAARTPAPQLPPPGTSGGGREPSHRAYVHPALLDRSSSYWQLGALGDPESVLAKLPSVAEAVAGAARLALYKPSTPIARALVILPAQASPGLLDTIARRVVFVSAVYPTHAYTVVAALVTPDQVEALAATPGVLAVLPDLRVDLAIGMRVGGSVRSPEFIDANSPGARPTTKPDMLQVTQVEDYGLGYHYTVNLTGAARVWEEYNETGEYATIVIIDTGVDYASPALGEDAIAHDEYGLPMILDMSGGIVFFPVNATIVNETTIFVNASSLYAWIPLLEYLVKYDKAIVYSNSYIEYNLTGYYRVPEWAVNNSLAAGKPIRFGVAYQTVLDPLGNTIIVSAPAIIVPNNETGLYDTILLDLSTAAYYLNQSFNGTAVVAGAPAAPDYSFADEKPITYGSEVAARDLDGDGYYDISFGALAGYEYDAYGLILAEKLGVFQEFFSTAEPGFYYMPQLTQREQWDMENIGAFWIGVDVEEGRYAALEYDFHSHGTFCASTAAGRPVPAYTGYGYYGLSTVVGQAPGAKVGAANFFFTGDALAAIYWFSGMDLVSEYAGLVDGGHYRVPVPSTENPWIGFLGYTWSWSPTGSWHKADLTSNSWGASGWALWGWASGFDPISVGIDYASFTTGTLHLVAAGNGGSGYGTVTVPGASTAALTVGAATEFTYRPVYGYLPGGNREVVSWSDRGPTEMGLAKPDIVAIGSFAYAVGRTWDSLAWGELTGSPFYTVDLFGGTSQATPMTAGVAALLASYAKRHGDILGFQWLKILLASGAVDMGFNPVSQGAGFVNAYRSIAKLAALLNGSTPLLAFSPSVYRYYEKLLSVNLKAISYGALAGLPDIYAEPKVVLAGPAGGPASAVLYVSSNSTPVVEPLKLVRVFEKPLCGMPGAIVFQECSGSRVMLPLGSAGYFALVPLALIDPQALTGYDLVRIYAYYPFKYFDDGGRYYNTSHSIYYNGLELWYWIDLNHNGVIELNETARIQYDLRGANAFTVEAGKLAEQLAEIERLVQLYTGLNTSGATKMLLLVYRVWYNEWSGTGVEVPLSVIVEGYRLARAGEIKVVPAGSTEFAYVYRVATRLPAKPGIWEYYLRVSSGNDTVLVPLTVVSTARIGWYTYSLVLNTRSYRGDSRLLYHNGLLRGAFDYTWRYESGDWRVYPVTITDPAVMALLVDVYWGTGSDPSYTSNLDVAVFGPHTYMMALEDNANATTYLVQPVKVNGLELGAELASSHTVFWDDPAPGHTRIIVPVQGPGTYLLVIRSLQFSGEASYDSFTAVVRPVKAHTPAVPASPGATVEAKVYLTLPAILEADGVAATAPGDLFMMSSSGLYYVPNATAVGVVLGNASVVASTYWGRTRIAVALPVTIPEDIIVTSIYPVVAVTLPVPVTSIGSLSHGEASVSFYWNTLGFTPRIVVR